MSSDELAAEIMGVLDPLGKYGDPQKNIAWLAGVLTDFASQEIARPTERCAELEDRALAAEQNQWHAQERCDAYKGQVKAGDEQILALRDRAKEMQREKVELRQRCDAYKEALADLCDAWEYVPDKHDGGKYKGNVTNAHRAARAALAIHQDKTP